MFSWLTEMMLVDLGEPQAGPENSLYRDRAHSSRPIVFHRLHQLLPRIHNEGTVAGHRLADPLSAQHQRSSVLTSLELDSVAFGIEQYELGVSFHQIRRRPPHAPLQHDSRRMN